MYALQVIWKYFYSEQSAGEHGTMYQLRNLLNRSNVPKKPKKNFDACDDFLCTLVESLLLVATLEYLQMESLDDDPSVNVLPNANTLWTESHEKRANALEEICGSIIDKLVSFRFNNDTIQRTGDRVYDYTKKLASLGFFYLEFSDAIREGDGQRVLRCWRYLLTIFKNSGQKNYSLEAVNLLNQYQFVLPPIDAQKLIWNRLVNVHGIPGKNIPGDLCLEHLNRLCKQAVNDRGSNQSKEVIMFVGKVLGVLKPVLEQFDLQNNIITPSGAHKRPNSSKDRDKLIHHLKTVTPFSQQSARKHNTFPKPKDLLHSKTTNELIDWIESHI